MCACVHVFVRFDRLAVLVVEASPSRAEDPGFDSRSCRGNFSGSCHASHLKKYHSIGYPGSPGPSLGLAGPVSVYCDWVK